MAIRKHLREMVRRQAYHRGIKASVVVRHWRSVCNVYPKFVGQKEQKKGSNQPILKYPVPREARQTNLYS